MLLTLLFILGISVEAITGAIAASRKKMDFFGVIIIACIAGLGGGTLRDLLFNGHPLIWVAEPYYLLITSIAAVATIILAPSILRIMRLFLILDALGLATFVILGTQKAIDLGMPTSICFISGMITGISGGMLRDILCNDIPLVLRREIYALIALAGSILYLLLVKTHLLHPLVVGVTLSFTFGLRVIAIVFHIEMPVLDYSKLLKKSARQRRSHR